MNRQGKLSTENSKAKELFFFTNHFPFHFSDSYIDEEVSILSGYFRKIRVFSHNRDETPCRPVPANVEAQRMMIQFHMRHYLMAIGLIFRKVFWRELYQILFTYRQFPGPGIIKSIFKYWARSLAYKEYLKENTEGCEDVLVYSYFMLECTLAAVMMKKEKQVRIVSRLHGFDVYFERGEYGYLPFRTMLVQNLDALFFISENGRNYFADKLRLRDTPLMQKLRIARLGFHSEFHEQLSGSRHSPFRLVSTSWILENKRLKLIAEALTMLPHDLDIEWVHFGGYYGIDKAYYESFVAKTEEIGRVFPGIRIRLMGSTPKEEILRFYSQNEVHLFVNVSVSEGIPVSMMEACRHGIPVAGTLVGGVGEILEDGLNGFHLPPDLVAEDIAIRILETIRMSDEEYLQLRKNALRIWKERFDSTRNYHAFLNDLTGVWHLPQS